MSLGQSLVVVVALIVLFTFAVAGTVAFVMSRPPRARVPQSLLPPRPQAPLRVVRPRPVAAQPIHAAAAGRPGRPGEHGRHGGRAAA
ncbi:MAG TPA: hypothetical protein VHX66_09640 [Solirubrobacteraceae bacterium]|nr:hypothetical protein [Solirubrobacteraceae bacterium]